MVGGTDTRLDYDATTHRLSQRTWFGTAHVWDYTWNDRGELDGRVRSGPKTQTIDYTFDRASRLVRVQGQADLRYVYDAHGRRVRSNDDTARGYHPSYHVYSREGQYLYQEDTKAGVPRTEFFHLGRALVGERLGPSGGPHVETFLHTDHLGTPSVKTATNGIVDYRTRKTPYGAPYDGVWRNGPDFTGHVADRLNELIYMQQRYYDPAIGQFISPDPVGAKVGSFSRYWYADNNPYSRVDRDGRESGCLHANSCGNFSHVGVESAAGLIDFVPVLGDVKGFVDAYNDPSLANWSAAVIGLAGPIGDAVAKPLKALRTPAQLAAARARQIEHIFRPEHKLDALLAANGGSPERAFEALQEAANNALAAGLIKPMTNGVLPGGQAGAILNVNGIQVQLVGGKIDGDQVKLSSASRKFLEEE